MLLARTASLDASPAACDLQLDRLSADQRMRWSAIVQQVLAEDDLGRPLYPTLRQMWNQVAESGHEVFVELPEPSRSTRFTAGVFRVERVDADGLIVAVLRLHLETIDQAAVADSPSHGFRRFEGLGREARYLEVLGHELGHAVWTLADPARARRSMTLRGRSRELALAVREERLDKRSAILAEVVARVEAQEGPARAAEARVWRELVTSRAADGVPHRSPTPTVFGSLRPRRRPGGTGRLPQSRPWMR